jgi:acyl transferase domain-containing protein
MVAELYDVEPDFREPLAEAVTALEPALGRPLRPVLCQDPGRGPIEDPELAHAGLFAVEYALARLWGSWGVRPAALLGHSFGEYAAACLAGVLSLADAAELAVTRGRLVATLPEGAMLAVALGEQQLAEWLSPELSLAAVNGHARCVVSGPPGAVAALREKLAAADHATVSLPVRQAFHSRAVEPIQVALAAAAAGCRHRAPELPLLSGLTGDWWDGGGPGYWPRQLREPVRFAAALSRFAESGPDGEPLVLVEVGPDQALTALARDHLGRRATMVPSLPSARSTTPAHRVLLAGLGALWRTGAELDWPAFFRGERRRRVPLPG